MRIWTRFGVTLGGLVMLTAGVMPWLGDVRPITIPLSFLYGGSGPDSVVQGSFTESVGLVFIVAAVLAVIGGLYGFRVLSWLSGTVGLILLVTLFARMLYIFGGIPDHAYGAAVAEFSVLVILVNALWRPPEPTYRPADSGEWESDRLVTS